MWTVSYERISEDKTGQAAGVERQRNDNRLLARAKGLQVDHHYRDNSISALDETKVRPEFAKLLADVAAGKVGTVVVWHLDRLAVRMADLASLLEAARPHQVQIAAVHGVSIDLSDPTGVAVAQILVAIAEMERRHKGNRQKSANRQRAEKGGVGWTRRPFGYERIEGQIVTVPDEVVEFGRMVESVLGGETLAAVAAELNGRGVPTSTGGRWSVTAVRRVLLNPRHAGRAVSKGKDYGRGDWPPLIDDDTHERLVLLLRDGRRRTATTNTAKHLLSGIARCGRCGERMWASPWRGSRGDYMIYRCMDGMGHLVRKLDPVDELVTAVILERLARPDAAKLFAPDADLDGLRRRAVDLRRRRDAIASMLADNLLSPEAARDQAERLTAQLRDVEREIATATGTGPLAPLVDADDVTATWHGLGVATRRAIVDMLATVTVLPQGKGQRFDPASIEITWRRP